MRRFATDRALPAAMLIAFLVMIGNILAGAYMAHSMTRPQALVAVGAGMPNVTLPSLEDSSRGVNTQNLLGHSVLLTFWAVDCTNCADSLAAASAIEREHGSAGLITLAVNTDDAATYLRARGYSLAMPAELVALHDPGAALHRYLGRPRWVLLNPHGTVTARGNTLAPTAADLDAVLPG